MAQSSRNKRFQSDSGLRNNDENLKKKMHSLFFEVLQLADNSNILSSFNQHGPPGRCVVLDTSFKIWAWNFSCGAGSLW